jgi:hypothetical protein
MLEAFKENTCFQIKNLIISNHKCMGNIISLGIRLKTIYGKGKKRVKKGPGWGKIGQEGLKKATQRVQDRARRAQNSYPPIFEKIQIIKQT